ncbi:MAG: hypothetical protein NTV00_14380 [Methylococcales bacterium]|nr:hypothetical protein [Methylococcales bacterium]
MLERLIEFGINGHFFYFMPIGQLEKSCCSNSKLEVIDFDKTKEILSNITKLQQPKSADALKILPLLDRIDFIELKGFKKFIQYNQDKPDIDKEISYQVEKFGLTEKIRDSLFVLTLLTKLKEFECKKSEREQYQKATKNYIIVVDIDLYQNPIKDRLITLAFLSEATINIKSRILDELSQSVDRILISSLENLQKPMIISCKNIDSYYQKLLKK